MICRSCKSEIPAESKFCPLCGSDAIEQETKNVGFCANCGKPFTADEQFCGDCGQPTGAQTAPAAVAADTASAPAAPDMSAYIPEGQPNTVTLVKKNGSNKKWVVLAIIGAALILLTALFFIFRAPIQRAFMDNGSYARMIEGNGIKSVTSTIGSKKFSKKSAESIAKLASLSTQTSRYYDIEDMNFEEMFPAVSTLLMETMGVNSVEMVFGFDVQPGKDIDEVMDYSGVNIDELLEMINGTELKTVFAIDEQHLMGEVSIKDNTGFYVDARGLVYSDGTVAVVLPFLDNKGFVTQFDMDGSYSDEEFELTFEIDQAQVDRIINDLINIYLEAYGNADVTVADGSIRASSVSTKGRCITVELDGDDILDMAEAFIDYVADDEYIYSVVEQAADMAGTKVSKRDFTSVVKEASENLPEDLEVEIIIDTIVDFQDNVIAKSYEVISEDYNGNEESVRLAYAQNGGETGIIIATDEYEYTFDATGKTDGVATIAFDNGRSSSYEYEIMYKGFGIKDYFDGKMIVGTFSMDISEFVDEDVILEISSALSGSTWKGGISASVEDYGKFGVTADITPKKMTLPSIPSDVFNISDIDDLSTREQKKLQDYAIELVEEFAKRAESNSKSLIAQALVEVFDEFIDSIM